MSTDPTAKVRIEDGHETTARDDMEKRDNILPQDAPASLKTSTPSTVIDETAGQFKPADGYFTHHPAYVEQQAQSVLSSNASPSPSVSASDIIATGYIQVPDALSPLQSAERPSAHTTTSSLSVQTTDSAMTITGASSTPVLASTLQGPTYPNQSYAALHHQQYPSPHPPPTLRQRSSHPGQIYTFTSALASLHQSGSRTVGNSPAVTPGPGLFNLTPPLPTEYESPGTPGTYASPYLHFTQRVPPKETHVADVDVDPISGRKLINHYEIIDELGRGTHGKVKLGRDLTSNSYVAIKIVERFSRRRKLGKLGNTEDKVKKEIAILKQARHPNVVALLEVIDDPSRKKVYIVLEWVERGEIQWRARAPKEIAVVEARRYEREKSGNKDDRLEAEDVAILAEAQKRLAKLRRRQLRMFRRMRRDASKEPEAWSIELMGDDMSEVSDDDKLSRISTESHSSKLGVDNTRRGSRAPSPLPPHLEDTPVSPSGSYRSFTNEPRTVSPTTSRHDFAEPLYSGLEGTMYGAYVPSMYEQHRTSSAHSSIHSFGTRPISKHSLDGLSQLAVEVLDSELNPELEHVPLMTMQQIRVAFRDTLLGLQYLHQQGIVHRDIKPPNLLATKEHRVKISDFGVSYLGRPIHDGEPGEEVSEHETQDLADEAKELAKTVGTPAFYPPELCTTDQLDDPLPITKAIDVWALGVTLFCMLFARTPFVDNEFVVMRQIADEDIYIPRQRLRPVKAESKSRPSSHSRAFTPQSSGYRHELDIVYERISDELHDLLKRLLTKDPRQRISLQEVRHHAWVVADIPDNDKVTWLEATDPSKNPQGKKIEVSSEDVNTAVVPLQWVERVRTGIKNIGEKLGFGGSSKSTSRTRGQSNAGLGNSSSPVTSNASPSATVGREGRSDSMRGDDTILAALKASREGEHPLSRSVAASPELDKHNSAQDSHDDRSDSAAAATERIGRSTPLRPGPPERASTAMATGGSMRTVRQSDYRRSRHEDSPPPSPLLLETPTQIDSPGSVSGWGSGVARRIMRSVRERSTGRSFDARAPSSERRSMGSIDTHGDPSIAMSPTTVEGHLNSPPALDEVVPRSATSSAQNSPSVSRPVSIPSSPLGEMLSPLAAEEGLLSRVSSALSVSSIGRRAVFGNLNRSPARSRVSSQSRGVPPSSTQAEWNRAEEEHIRKLVREHEEDSLPLQSPFDNRDCPPSPDDQRPKRFDSRRMSELDISNPESPNETSPTGPNAQFATPLISSTSDFGSTVSASMSNPSIPSVISEASSVDPRDTLSREESEPKADLMSSDETVNPMIQHQEVQDEGYIADDNDNALNSDHDEDYDDSSDSDGGLVMRRKSTTKVPSPVVNQGTTADKDSHSAGLSAHAKKSSRSGSSNTMRKFALHPSEDRDRRPSHEGSNS